MDDPRRSPAWAAVVTALLCVAVSAGGCGPRRPISPDDVIAISRLRSLQTSLEVYRKMKGVFPGRWSQVYDVGTEFAPSPEFRTSSGTLSGHAVEGHRYTYAPRGIHGFILTATPVVAGKTGYRSYYLDDTMVFRHCLASSQGQGASAGDPTVDEPPDQC